MWANSNKNFNYTFQSQILGLYLTSLLEELKWGAGITTSTTSYN